MATPSRSRNRRCETTMPASASEAWIYAVRARYGGRGGPPQERRGCNSSSEDAVSQPLAAATPLGTLTVAELAVSHIGSLGPQHGNSSDDRCVLSCALFRYEALPSSSISQSAVRFDSAGAAIIEIAWLPRIRFVRSGCSWSGAKRLPPDHAIRGLSGDAESLSSHRVRRGCWEPPVHLGRHVVERGRRWIHHHAPPQSECVLLPF
jgi:hypothetical protein